MPNVWTINGVTGGASKNDLVGCHIKVNDDGTAYEFTDRNINTVLQTTSGGSLPTTPFSFPSFPFKGYNWVITVETLTGGAGGNQAQGDWSNDAPGIAAEQEGTYTAQAGSGEDAEEDREAAASA